MVEAVYPEFYKLGINSDKPGDVLESEFLKEDWMTVELVEELSNFVRTLFNANQSKENIELVLDIASQKYYLHFFPLRREFTNYRQLEQYVYLFLKSWKVRKNRHGFSFKYVYAQPNRNYIVKNEYLRHKDRPI